MLIQIDSLPEPFFVFFIFLFGACLGSFLNVLIYRLPRGKSIVSPGSFCPACLTPIKWYHNIPILSYVFLKGRCHYCNVRISIRYPMVELITAFLGVALFYKFGITINLLIYWAFFMALIVVSLIDFEHMEIPDEITIPGIFIGVAVCFFYPALLMEKSRFLSFVDSLAGVLLGGGILFAVGIVGELILKKEAMGGGDIKLLAMIGAFIGWRNIFFVFFLACLFGAVFGSISKIITKKDLIPFGPFLSAAAFLVTFFSNTFWGMFYRLYGF